MRPLKVDLCAFENECQRATLNVSNETYMYMGSFTGNSAIAFSYMAILIVKITTQLLYRYLILQ